MVEVHPDIDGETRPREFEILALASRQHGVVTRRQLEDIGLGRGAIDHRLSVGRLVLVHRGVYAIGCTRPIGNGRLMAAVLAFGDGALVSHRNAGALWGSRPTQDRGST